MTITIKWHRIWVEKYPCTYASPYTHALHLDCFNTKNLHISHQEAEKTWMFTPGTVPGTRKVAMVSDLRISESSRETTREFALRCYDEGTGYHHSIGRGVTDPARSGVGATGSQGGAPQKETDGGVLNMK